jgi:hypothetical protein
MQLCVITEDLLYMQTNRPAMGNHQLCIEMCFYAFILWNNSGVTNLQILYHAVFHILIGPRPQDAGTPLLSSVLTSESDSGPGKGLHRQSNLPRCLHRLFATAKKMNYFYNLNCSA